jgi:hypothetical protein
LDIGALLLWNVRIGAADARGCKVNLGPFDYIVTNQNGDIPNQIFVRGRKGLVVRGNESFGRFHDEFECFDFLVQFFYLSEWILI